MAIPILPVIAPDQPSTLIEDDDPEVQLSSNTKAHPPKKRENDDHGSQTKTYGNKSRCQSCGKTIKPGIGHCPRCGVRIRKTKINDDKNDSHIEVGLRRNRATHDQVRTLRWLVIIDAVISFLLFPAYMFEGAIIEALAPRQGVGNIIAPRANVPMLIFLCSILVILMALSLVAWVGLYNLKPWSRWLFLGITIAGFALQVIFGLFDFSYRWGLISALDSSSQLLVGAILAMVFVSPLREKFNAK